METYEQLLDKAYKNLKTVQSTGERFDLPKVQGEISGNATIITNLKVIADYIRRPMDHMVKFLLKELATPGAIDGDRFILKTKLNSARVNEKLVQYVDLFVTCPECKKPDTEMVSEKGIKFKHCLACGAKTPIKSKI